VSFGFHCCEGTRLIELDAQSVVLRDEADLRNEVDHLGSSRLTDSFIEAFTEAFIEALTDVFTEAFTEAFKLRNPPLGVGGALRLNSFGTVTAKE